MFGNREHRFLDEGLDASCGSRIVTRDVLNDLRKIVARLGSPDDGQHASIRLGCHELFRPRNDLVHFGHDRIVRNARPLIVQAGLHL